MNKHKFLETLREILEDKSVKQNEVDQIINDYDDLYTQGLEQGLSDDEVISKLGTPREVYQSLKDDLPFSYHTSKLTGVMVFVAIILFFISGQLLELWKYSWLFFLLIPISGILSNARKKEMLPGLAVFISVAVYYILGTSLGLWHPGWLIFLSIPISGVLISKNKKPLLSLSPFIAIIIYFIVSYFYQDFYLYGWPIFLIIPIIDSFTIKKPLFRYLMLASLIISIAGYYLLAIQTQNWAYPLFIFALPVLVGILTNEFIIQIDITGYNKNDSFIIAGAILVAIVYLLISLLTTAWDKTWLILLLIPMIAIYATNKFKHIVAYTPFIATIIFFLVGMFIDGGYKFAWLIYFIIPITAILTGDTDGDNVGVTVNKGPSGNNFEEDDDDYDEDDEDSHLNDIQI